MIKKTFVAALALLAAGSLFAQNEETDGITKTVEYSSDKYKVETNRFWNNWFISAGAGAQIFFSDHDKQMKFGQRISPALDIAVGKWFTPGIGVRAMYSGLTLKGATQNDSYTNGEPIDNKPWSGYWLKEQKIKFFNVHADVMFDLTSLIGGYKEKRVYRIAPYFGLGVIHTWQDPKKTNVSANFGIMNSFRLCSCLDLNLDLRGTMMNDEFDGEGAGRYGEGFFTASLGLTYKFKPRGWGRSKTITYFDNRAINELRGENEKLNAENERLQRELEAERNKEVAPVKQVVASNLITFQIGKSKLSNEARANLGMMAEIIRQSDPGTVYVITGYADAGTGSKKLNERLSKQRAEAVRDCLVNEFGVSESQLRIDYKGGVENMFYDDPRLSRAVITKAAAE